MVGLPVLNWRLCLARGMSAQLPATRPCDFCSVEVTLVTNHSKCQLYKLCVLFSGSQDITRPRTGIYDTRGVHQCREKLLKDR